jgi:hypothetical protein
MLGRLETARCSPLVPIQTGGSRPPFYAMHNLEGRVMLLALVDTINPQRLAPPFHSWKANPIGVGSCSVAHIPNISRVLPWSDCSLSPQRPSTAMNGPPTGAGARSQDAASEFTTYHVDRVDPGSGFKNNTCR